MATYVRVVEAGSLSAAAKQLRLSTAAVSRQLATLEAELRVPLLVRSTRRMTITTDGQHYYERCLRILRDVEDAQALGRGSRVEGLLKVSAPVPFGMACVVPAMNALLTKHPNLRIDLRLEDRMIDLALEGVDVALRVGRAPSDSTDVVAHRLLTFQRQLVASPQYLKRHGEPKTPEALAKHNALVYVPDTDTWTLTRGESETRIRLNVRFRCNVVHAVRELALQHHGIALLPDWFLTETIARRELKVLLPEWKSTAISVNALHRTTQRGELRVKALIEHLRVVCATWQAEPRGST